MQDVLRGSIKYDNTKGRTENREALGRVPSSKKTLRNRTEHDIKVVKK